MRRLRVGWCAPLLPCIAAALAIAAARPPAMSEPVAATLLLRVIDSITRRPLPNAEVTAQARRGLTDERGEVRILWPEDGELRLRIRQLGFRYADRTIHRDRSSRAEEDTLVVALARTGWSLPQVVVRADQRCPDRGDPNRIALSHSSMELLRFGAEQFDNFRRAYPFDIATERRTVLSAPQGHMPPRPRVETDTTPSNAWGDRYVADSVVQRRGATDYFVPLLFVSALADSAFWSRHCFRARGVESREGRRLIRLDFTPALDVRGPEWEGSAWLDSARSVLARVDFRLTNLRHLEGPEQFEGYTIFSTPTPYIAMPDSTVAWWTTQARAGVYGEARRSGGTQVLLFRDVVYRGRRPPGGAP